jgi:putative MATE family efflux protein
MSVQTRKNELLGNAPVRHALCAMGLPTMIGMMISALYNLVDAYFVGGLGTSQMGAISVAFPLGQLIVGTGLLFGSGAGSYISRLLGQGDTHTARTVATTTLYASLAAGILLITISLIFITPLLTAAGATASIMPYAVSYTRIYLMGSVFTIFNVTMNTIVTSEGAPRTTMCALLSGALINIILDPVCIYVFDQGVAGAACATAVSQVVSTLIYVWYVLRRKSIISFSLHYFMLSKKTITEILKIGVPVLVFQILTSTSIMLINLTAKKYGDPVIAGMGAVTRIIAMGSLMVFGFIKGFQPVAGYSFGAGNYQRLHDATRISLKWATLFCTVYGSTAALFAKPLITTFTTGDTEMIAAGTTALRANGLSFIFFGISAVYSSLFLAIGKGKTGFILGACRQGICFVPLILLLPQLAGKYGIFYAQPAADLLTVLVTFLICRHTRIFYSCRI